MAKQSETKDPLAVLVSSDVNSTDRKRLAELVKPFLIIDQKSKELAALPAFESLGDNAVKVEIILAGAKARALLFNVPDGMTQGEIIGLSVLADGSVKSTLKRLADGHKIKKDKEGRYLIPGHRVSELVKKIADNNS